MESSEHEPLLERTVDLYTKTFVTNAKTGRRNQLLRCKICFMTSTKSFEMENHIRLHTRSRPFICQRCGVTFTTMGNKQRHLAHDSCGKQKSKQRAAHDVLEVVGGELRPDGRLRLWRSQGLRARVNATGT